MSFQIAMRPFPLCYTIRSTFFFFELAVCLAQSQIGQTQEQVSGTEDRQHVISGTVVNSVTGMPIARALVELNAQTRRHNLTEANGAFRFEGVSEGPARLEAERPGFLQPADLAPEMRTSTVSVQVAADVDGLVLKLVPQAEIAGYVQSVQGVPIENFPIDIYRRNIVDGRVQWQNAVSLVSGDDGYFRAFGLSPESVVVSAGPERWRLRPPGTKHLGYPALFYPNARGLTSAEVISLVPGQRVEADFSLSQEPLFEISGNISGVPEAIDAKVELTDSSGEVFSLVRSHPERHDFMGYAPEGRYMLRAAAEIEGQLWQATVPLSLSADAIGLSVVLVRRSPILVKVHNETDAGQDRKSILPSVTVSLVSAAPSLTPRRFGTSQKKDGDGKILEINSVESGSYAVEFRPYGGYVKSATSGSTDLLHDELLIPDDGRVAPLEIVLDNDGGEVSGSVKFPEHHSSAVVLLVPDGGPSREIQSLILDSTNQFQFEQVRPGNYILLGFAHSEDLEYRNPDVLGAYLSSGVRLTVAPRQSIAASPELIVLGK
jgi:hypothetical protein